MTTNNHSEYDWSGGNPRIQQIIRIWGDSRPGNDCHSSPDDARTALGNLTRLDAIGLFAILEHPIELVRLAGIRGLVHAFRGPPAHGFEYGTEFPPIGASPEPMFTVPPHKVMSKSMGIRPHGSETAAFLFNSEPWLVAALDGEWLVAREAALALTLIGWDSEKTAAALLAHMPRSHTQPSSRRVSWPVGVAAARALATYDPDNTALIPVLVDWLEHGNVIARCSAANLLGELSRCPDVSVAALVPAVSDHIGSVRDCAARALANFGHAARTAVPALRAKLDEEIRFLRGDAIISPDADVRELLNAIQRNGMSPALEALSRIEPEVWQQATTHLANEISSDRTAAAIRLRQISNESGEANERQFFRWSRGGIERLHTGMTLIRQGMLDRIPQISPFLRAVDLMQIVVDLNECRQMEGPCYIDPTSQVLLICQLLSNLADHLATTELQYVAAEAVAAAVQRLADAAAWQFVTPPCDFRNPTSPLWDPLDLWRREEMREPWYFEPVDHLLAAAELYCRAA